MQALYNRCSSGRLRWSWHHARRSCSSRTRAGWVGYHRSHRRDGPRRSRDRFGELVMVIAWTISCTAIPLFTLLGVLGCTRLIASTGTTGVLEQRVLRIILRSAKGKSQLSEWSKLCIVDHTPSELSTRALVSKRPWRYNQCSTRCDV